MFDKAKKDLALAKQIDEVKEIRDSAWAPYVNMKSRLVSLRK